MTYKVLAYEKDRTNPLNMLFTSNKNEAVTLGKSLQRQYYLVKVLDDSNVNHINDSTGGSVDMSQYVGNSASDIATYLSTNTTKQAQVLSSLGYLASTGVEF